MTRAALLRPPSSRDACGGHPHACRPQVLYSRGVDSSRPPVPRRAPFPRSSCARRWLDRSGPSGDTSGKSSKRPVFTRVDRPSLRCNRLTRRPSSCCGADDREQASHDDFLGALDRPYRRAGDRHTRSPSRDDGFRLACRIASSIEWTRPRAPRPTRDLTRAGKAYYLKRDTWNISRRITPQLAQPARRSPWSSTPPTASSSSSRRLERLGRRREMP